VSRLRRWLLIILVTISLSVVMSVPIAADFFSGQTGYLSLSSSGTSNSYLTIGTSTTVNSYLSIGISSITAPSITADSATAITNTSARLNSTVTSDGGDSIQVRFGIGTVSQTAVNFNSYTYISPWVGGTPSFHTGSKPFLDKTGLGTSTTYYYRVQVKNTYGTVTSTNEKIFTALTGIGDVTNLVAIPSGSNISLMWAIGSGSTSTVIRYRSDTYPVSQTDGTEVIGVGIYSCIMTNVVAGQTYYFSAYGYDGISYSATAAHAVANGSAGSGVSPTVNLVMPSIPANALATPTISQFNFEPFTTIISNFTNGPGGLGMPINNLWEGIATIILVLAGLLVANGKKSLAAGWAVITVGAFIGTGLHIFQSVMIFVIVVVGWGVWAIERYLQ